MCNSNLELSSSFDQVPMNECFLLLNVNLLGNLKSGLYKNILIIFNAYISECSGY